MLRVLHTVPWTRALLSLTLDSLHWINIGGIHHQNIVLTFLGYIYWIYMDLFLNAVCFPQKMAMLARTRRCPNLARPQKQGKLLALTHGLLYLWFICDHFYIFRSISLIFLSFLFFYYYFLNPSYSQMKSSASQDDFKIKVHVTFLSYHVWCPLGGSAV